MSDNTSTAGEELNPQELAERAMADIMADSTRTLTDYLRVHAARITAERKIEDLAREEWAMWRALTSTKKGGFTEAQLRRQAIHPPAPMPRRDRGKKRSTKAATKSVQAPADSTDERQATALPDSGSNQFGG